MRSMLLRISVTASAVTGMGQRFQPRQPEKAASALDGVDQTKNVIEDLRVIRILLEPNQLIIDRIQALVGLRQEFPQKIVHQNTPSKRWCCGRPSTVLEIVERAFLFAINNPSGLTTTLIFLSVQIRMKQAQQARASWKPAACNTAPDMPRPTCLIGGEFTPCRFYGLAQSSSAVTTLRSESMSIRELNVA